MTDAQVAALALPPEGIRLRISPVIEKRFVGTKQLPPGPPPGLKRNADGSQTLQNVAIVRVAHETETLAARQLYKSAIARSALIGLVSGLVALVLASAFYWTRQRAPAPISDISAPCQIGAMDQRTLICAQGAQAVPVQPGQLFPDGRYQLINIDVTSQSFSAIRVADQTAVLFQRSLIPPPSMELSRK